MKIIPAIDLIDNKCVRLVKGDYSQMKIYSDNPPDMARKLEAEGADIIHVVDLSGAKKGQVVHAGVIEKINKAVSIPVEVGGGIRSRDDVNLLLDIGIPRLILGSILIKNKELACSLLAEYNDKIVLGIDAFTSKIAIHGWQETTEIKVLDLIKEYEQYGLSQVIYTDINTDGLLQGPNIDMLSYLSKNTSVELIASGGISSLEDIKKILLLKEQGLFGFIVGKAIYEGMLDLADIKEIVHG